MRIIYSEEFQKTYAKIKDKKTRERILRNIKILEIFPETGKPLRYDLSDFRSIRIKPYRMIYKIQKDTVILMKFEHRKTVYD